MTKMNLTLAVVLTVVLGAVPLACAKDPITLALPPDGLSPQQRLPLQNYLTEQMGRDVKVVTPDSYAITLDGLSNGTIDFACLGGLTYLKAHARSGVVPLVQRVSDLQFHSVFIAGAGTSIHSLNDLKGRKFAFGDINSTSGHLMPYLELKRAGLNADTDLQVRYSGEHPATVKLVELGIVDAGALDETFFNTMIKDGRANPSKVRVIYTSKPFVDWVYAARKGISDADREKFTAAMLALREGKNDDILKIVRATRFVRANDDEYGTLREVAHELKMF
ncbi:MAG TPA: phosphate/phosphite/phosphonate ABC transporter substrate-binding protein [Candidatus Angelobacter sp.]